jgi:hypothetical protein
MGEIEATSLSLRRRTRNRKRDKSKTLTLAAMFALSVLCARFGFEAYATTEFSVLSKVNSALGSQDDDNFYSISTAPKEASEWIMNRIVVGPDCRSFPGALIASCCRSSCGVFGDRIMGLSALLLASESVGRRLCIAKDYFISGPKPECKEGPFLMLQGNKSVQFDHPWLINPKPTKIWNGNRKSEEVKCALEVARYVTSAEPAKLPLFGGSQQNARQMGKTLRYAFTIVTAKTMNTM